MRKGVTEVLCAKVYPGNMLDAKAFHDFIADNNINRGILICDKGFPVSNIEDLLEANPDLHYISPIRRNSTLISQHRMLESDQVATFCDKGFPVSNIEDLLEANPDLHYISPIRRNSTLISQHRMLESDQVATLDDGNVVMYKKVKLDDGRCLYCIRDIGRSNFEKKGILDRALAKDCKIDGESFVNKLAVKLDDGRCLYCIRDIGRSNFEKKGILDRALAKDCKIDGESFVNKLASQGTITFVSDLDLDPLAILNHYNNRWQLEVVFDHFKNTLDLDITRVQSKTSVIGNEFINFLATPFLTTTIIDGSLR